MTQTSVSTPQTATRSGRLQQFAAVYAREHGTTVKVLNAFPEQHASYRPHERSDSALQLAWRFVIENGVALAALHGPLNVEGRVLPPPPPDFQEVIAAYRSSAAELMEQLRGTPESRLEESVKFFVGPGKMGDFEVGELLWFLLLDSIHHRGQLSVYVRCAGGKVPSIYGPSADEPWT